jgi:hypothetical protein
MNFWNSERRVKFASILQRRNKSQLAKPETRGIIIVSDAMNVLRRELSDLP